MMFRELSNAAFHFSLRQPGAEITGGGVQTPPPPQQAVENPEAQRLVKVTTSHQSQNVPKFPNDVTWLHIIRIISVPKSYSKN